jgi:predicted transcriptional regulator
MTEQSIHDPALGRVKFPGQDRTADRLRAYELYLNSTLSGDRRSIRSIAQELGVNVTQVSAWKTQDRWTPRIDEALETTTALAESTSQVIKRLVRRGLISGLREIEKIINADLTKNHKVTADDKIKALRALAEISIKLDAIAQGAGPGASGGMHKPMGFKDDLEDGLQLDAKAPQPVGSQELGSQPGPEERDGSAAGGLDESSTRNE